MSMLPYPDYENKSGWNRLLPPRTGILTLNSDNRADVIVIGAGFTGLAAARERVAQTSRDEMWPSLPVPAHFAHQVVEPPGKATPAPRRPHPCAPISPTSA